MKMSLRGVSRVLVPFLSLAVVSISSAASAKANAAANNKTDATAYSAQSVAVKIEGARNVGPIVISDTGAIATSGGLLTASTADVNIAGGGLTVATADAEAEGTGPEATAEARVGKFHVEVAMWTGNIIIEADYIAANVSASSNPGGKTALSSQVQIQNLTVNGHVVTVTGQPNQEVTFSDVLDTKLIINEQVSDSVRGSADIDLTALHFWACDIEGRIGVIHAGITVNGKPEPEDHTCGKITGGGWITGTPS